MGSCERPSNAFTNSKGLPGLSHVDLHSLVQWFPTHSSYFRGLGPSVSFYLEKNIFPRHALAKIHFQMNYFTIIKTSDLFSFLNDLVIISPIQVS